MGGKDSSSGSENYYYSNSNSTYTETEELEEREREREREREGERERELELEPETEPDEENTSAGSTDSSESNQNNTHRILIKRTKKPKQQQQQQQQQQQHQHQYNSSDFYHSHHLTTSIHNPAYVYHPITDSTQSNNPSKISIALDLPTHPPKPSWFSSRRSKRKHSIHALSATSTSSTASIHSSPPPLDQFGSKNLDSLLPKYPLPSSTNTPTSSRRLSTNRLKRWMRSSLNQPGSLIRWLKKSSSGPRLPLGILLGLLLFVAFAVSLTVFLIHYLDTDKEPLPWRTYCQEQPEFPHELADSLEPVNVFVGVFSVDSAYERRHLIRSTYARHSRPIDPLTGQISHNVQLKFILGKPRIQHVRRVALEMETYNDIVVLDIQENMNRGKTYAFLSWASENATVPVYYHPIHEPKPKMGINGIGGVLSPESVETINVSVGFKKADFVVKADDDAFIVLSELERHLRVAPRTMTYWGYLIRNLFMGGECYALSADLVSYVANSQTVLDHLTGAEDKKVAKWMRIHPNATEINWVTERCWIYDHPKAGTTYAHGFLFPDQEQRIREEGKFGLSEAEIESRGPGRAQSYSSVIKWKERYVAPKGMMTMEEEVEALVEGGGRFSKTAWKRPAEKESYVPLEKVVFDPDDRRLLKSSLMGDSSGSAQPSKPLPHQFTPPVKDHYQEPALKFGRPSNELMAKMPAIEDLPESPLKDKLREGLVDEMMDPTLSSKNKNKSTTIGERQTRDDQDEEEDEEDETRLQKKASVQFVPSPTLRFDLEEIRIRNQRFLNRPHGGTVVVHYLKRSEWFLETSLVLLGRAKTWDDGIIPAVYEPRHQLRSASHTGADRPSRLTIEPDGPSVLSSATDQPRTLSSVDRASSPSSSQDERQSPSPSPSQKKIKVNEMTDWGKFEQVEEIRVGGMFGGARMYGSPVVENDGSISEGRRKIAMVAPGSRPATAGAGAAEQGGKAAVKAPPPVDGPPPANGEDPAEDAKADEIRKTQFGGAGWIRGKPRLRVADEAAGPRFGPSEPTPAAADSHDDDDEDEFPFVQPADDSLVLAPHQLENLHAHPALVADPPSIAQ